MVVCALCSVSLARAQAEFAPDASIEAGCLIDVLFSLDQMVVEQCGSRQAADRGWFSLRDDTARMARIAEIIAEGEGPRCRPATRIPAPTPHYEVVIPLGTSLEDLFKAVFGQVPPGICLEDFPSPVSGRFEVVLIRGDDLRQHRWYSLMDSVEVCDWMAGQALVPARLEHLLAFRVSYPEVNLQSDVLALGSYFSYPQQDGYFWYVPALSGSKNEPILDIIRGDGKFRSYRDFLAVREERIPEH